MMWLEELFKGDNGGAWQLIASAVVLVVLLIVLFWIFRKIIGNSRLKTTKNRVPRLSVTDSMPVDETRHLVLIRRDNLEHLVLIGGPSDVVIETGIVRVPKNNQNGAKNTLSPIDPVTTEDAQEPAKSSSMLGAIGGATAAGVAGMGDALSATKDVVTDTGSAMVDKTGDVASGAVETTKDAATAVVDKTTEVASAAVETTKDVAEKVVDTTKDVAKSVGETTSDIASAAVETSKDAAEATTDVVSDTVKATVDAVTPEETQIAEVEIEEVLEEIPDVDLEASLTEHLDQELSIAPPQSDADATVDADAKAEEAEPEKSSSSKEELQKLLDELAT